LKDQVSEALAGERLASFLPIISELTEKYDAQAIAAAALQLAYDQTRPAWLQNGVDVPDEEPTPKPKLNKRRDGDRSERNFGGDYNERSGGSRGRSWSKSDRNGDEGRPTPKPKLRKERQERYDRHESPVLPGNQKQI
jgi:ATP-dependent RNA helicase DeaD